MSLCDLARNTSNLEYAIELTIRGVLEDEHDHEIPWIEAKSAALGVIALLRSRGDLASTAEREYAVCMNGPHIGTVLEVHQPDKLWPGLLFRTEGTLSEPPGEKVLYRPRLAPDGEYIRDAQGRVCLYA